MKTYKIIPTTNKFTPKEPYNAMLWDGTNTKQVIDWLASHGINLQEVVADDDAHYLVFGPHERNFAASVGEYILIDHVERENNARYYLNHEYKPRVYGRVCFENHFNPVQP